MTKEIRSQWVKVHNGDLAIDAYLAQPLENQTYPAILVYQEIFGVNAHIREVTERIAQQGYIAIAPALYQRLAPQFETGYNAEAIKIGRDYKAQTKASELLSDTEATIAYLKTLPAFGKAIGTIGFCFGGHVAYLTATLPDIKAAASFYGAGIVTMCPGEERPTVTRTAEIKGTLYAFFGMEDASIPAAEVDRIEAELTQYRIPHQVFRYPGADHGFFCNERSTFNPEVAAEAWQQVLQLFERVLNAQ